jgi:PPOX class probable F420-dependent enzyme
MSDTTPSLSAAVVELLAARNMVSVATIDPDGKPRQTVTWFRLEADGRILINGRLPRRWCANLLRDPRVSLSIIDMANPYTWVGLTGIVDEVVDDVAVAREDIVELAHRYRDGDPDPDSIASFRSQPRLSYYVRITGVYEHFED